MTQFCATIMESRINILTFSEYIVDYFNYYQEPVTNKKLQKLLYYIQGWHLAYFDNQLFDEIPEAWVHGPVYPTVYQKYKEFKFNPLASTKEFIDINTLTSDILEFNFTKDQNDFLSSVLKHYGSKSAFELEMRSHNELPWIDARKGLDDIDICQKQINIDIMKEYFKSRIKK